MTLACEDVRVVAADLALDELVGVERAEVIAHLAGCDACRSLVAELAVVADSLLLLAPPAEPPSGFESRVLERIGPAARRRPRWIFAVVAAAVVAAVLGAGVGYLAAGAGDTGDLPVAMLLRSADGAAAGSVVVADDPDRMTCVFEGERFGGAYEVEVVLAGGGVEHVGRFTAEGAPWSWTVALPVDAAEVRGVRVRSSDGVVRASGERSG